MNSVSKFCSHCGWLVFVSTTVLLAQARAASAWTRPEPANPARVEMTGEWGKMYSRGLDRIGRDPFTTEFILADVNFGMKRWFTNFSGDISGRFLELAATTSPPGQPRPPALSEVMAQITRYQKADGHYGADVDWSKPIDFSVTSDQTKVMPILWGNGRLLLGLVAAYERFGQPQLLESAKRLGDFYVNIVVARFCDPARLNEYRQPASYACNFVTCVFEGMEGLIQLHKVTKDPRHLDAARRMADFHELFDTLPVDHAHGSLSQHQALLMLHRTTRQGKYLERVASRWNAAVTNGFVNPAGGVLEKFWTTGFNRDEGCAEADWLRLNLELWLETGETRYLDMAERLLGAAFPANQWPSGGFGHRYIGFDTNGPFAFRKPSQESLWCCSFHAPLSLYHLKSCLAAGDRRGLFYNFPADFKAAVRAGNNDWLVTSQTLPSDDGAPVRCDVTLSGPKRASIKLRARMPDWADMIEITRKGKPVKTSRKGGYIETGRVSSGQTLRITYHARPYLENRRFARLPIPSALPARLEQVVVRHGPYVLMNTQSGDIRELTMQTDGKGCLTMPQPDAPVTIAPWPQLDNPTKPHAFVFNVKVENKP